MGYWWRREIGPRARPCRASAAPGSSIRNVSTGHRIVKAWQHTLAQYQTSHSTRVAAYAMAVPDIA
eukprot:1230245-Rhodomonas_salina.2